MLKGILFIIAIIVTFDIGKALINSYREEQTLEKAQEQINSEQRSASGNDTNTIEENSDKAPLNLNLPEGSHEEEQADEPQIDSQSSFSTSTGKEKSLNLNAKPMMTFDVETRTPDVTGVTVEVKKNY